MKTMETKFRSTLNLPGQLITQVIWCFGAVILICSTAPAQNLFMSSNDGQTGVVFEFTPDGAQSTFASGLSNPQGLAFDSSGNLFVADGDSILKFTPNGVRTTFALGLSGPIGLAIDSADNVFVADGAIYKFTPDGVRTTFASGLEGPWGLAFDSAGNLFVTDGIDVVGPGHAHVYKFTPDGVRTTIASGLLAPEDLAFDSTGNLFVLEAGDIDGLGAAIYKFTPEGRQTTFASPFLCIGPGLAIDGADNLFLPDWCTGNIYEFTPQRVQTTFGSGSRSAGFLAFEPTETSTPTTNPRITVSAAANRINQGAYATFTISASTMNPSHVTTIHYAMSGKAKPGVNYTLSGVFGEADIPAGASSTTVTLQALNAPMRGKSAKATMTIMSGADYTLSNPKRATVTIAK